jgi:hypothetical protein
MREFLWGLAWGALVVFLYANYGDNLQSFRHYTLDWRDWAVGHSSGYAAGHEKK